jgi:hypothetical protein
MIWRRQLFFYSEVVGLANYFKAESSIAFAAGATKFDIYLSKEEVSVYHFAFDIPKKTCFEAYAWMERKTV